MLKQEIQPGPAFQFLFHTKKQIRDCLYNEVSVERTYTQIYSLDQLSFFLFIGQQEIRESVYFRTTHAQNQKSSLNQHSSSSFTGELRNSGVVILR